MRLLLAYPVGNNGQPKFASHNRVITSYTDDVMTLIKCKSLYRAGLRIRPSREKPDPDLTVNKKEPGRNKTEWKSPLNFSLNIKVHIIEILKAFFYSDVWSQIRPYHYEIKYPDQTSTTKNGSGSNQKNRIRNPDNVHTIWSSAL